MASSAKVFPGSMVYQGSSLEGDDGLFDIDLPEIEDTSSTVSPKRGIDNQLYNSEIIRSLRDANTLPLTNNPGIKFYDNAANSKLILDLDRPVPIGLSNRPKTLELPTVVPPPLLPTVVVGDGNSGSGGNGGGVGSGIGGGVGGGGDVGVGDSDGKKGNDDGDDYSGSDLIGDGDDYSGSDLIGDGDDYSGGDLIGDGDDYSGGDLIGDGDDYSGGDLIGDGDGGLGNVGTDLGDDLIGATEDDDGTTSLGFTGDLTPDELDYLIAESLANERQEDVDSDDVVVDNSSGINFGQAKNLGGIFKMYDPLDDFFLFDLK